MTLEEMKKTIKERENIRKVSGAIKIGTLLATYLVWKSKNMTPFTEDMLKYYVPAIETVNEDDERTKAVFAPEKKTLEGYKNVKLLVEYNTAWEKTNNGLYRKMHSIYSYKNIKEEDIKDIVSNPELLNEYLTKESEFPEYTETIDEINNYPTYNIQILNKEKSIYQNELESRKDAVLDTITYLLVNGIFLGMLFMADENENKYTEKLKREYQVLSRKKK